MQLMVVTASSQNGTLISEMPDEQTKSAMEICAYQRFYGSFLDNNLSSNLDKLHFIVGHGILRPTLRYF